MEEQDDIKVKEVLPNKETDDEVINEEVRSGTPVKRKRKCFKRLRRFLRKVFHIKKGPCRIN